MSKSDFHYKPMIGGEAYKRPCRKCGATHRTETGQDPCIADLPGVLHACCGHGEGQGYVMFENGMVLRGYFEQDEAAKNLEVQRIWGLVL